MVKAELIKRSPLRVFEKSIHGGLGRGNLGVLASPKGVGKTACLVHIATDKLFQGKPVIHVSYSSRVDYIITWYEDIFKEIAKNRKLRSAVDVHDEIIKNRVIMNFKQEGTRTEQVLKSVEAMITFGKFAADSVIVDGYDFVQGTCESGSAPRSRRPNPASITTTPASRSRWRRSARRSMSSSPSRPRATTSSSRWSKTTDIPRPACSR
jgi:hypothetical protein